MSRGARLGHLSRRLRGALSRRPPAASDEAWVATQLAPGEVALWSEMAVADQRHSIEVARRFLAVRPAATRDEVAGALLHDVGKVQAGLGTLGRVVATAVGSRTASFRRYHQHEQLGAAMAADAGSSEVTVALIRGEGPAAADLRAADDSI